MRARAKQSRKMSFVVPGGYRICRLTAGGWLMQPLDPGLGTYWLPQPLTLRRLDAWNHILEERRAPIAAFECSPSQTSLGVSIPEGWALDCTLWHLPPSSSIELQTLCPLETQGIFLWGSHTLYRRPADVYKHVIHGHVYENRATWPKHWKISSENDAHALYTALSGLELATGKHFYQLLKRQLVMCVIERQGKDGGWRHGEWTDRMEAHLRLHCSGMHMLLDALSERDDVAIRTALEHAAAFLSRQVDRLDVGSWLLHDELEHSVEAMREGPFRWQPSRALGKSPANMLVLNSHLDGAIALHRYGEATGSREHEPLVSEARRATRAVMSLRTADWLYRAMFWAIRLTFLPTAIGAALPLHRRAMKRVAWRWLVPMLPWIKARFPRLVMPGGYIDRELSLRVLAHDYLPINLMDILRYGRRFQAESNEKAVRDGFALIHEARMFERWPEMGKAYALGFWAEALYQACLLYRDSTFVSWLANAIVQLEKRALGVPPSLLGANGEAVRMDHQVPTPLVDDDRIRVVNLCTEAAYDFLLVNCADTPIEVAVIRHAPQGLVWTAGETEKPTPSPSEIPAWGWLRGRGARAAPAAA